MGSGECSVAIFTLFGLVGEEGTGLSMKIGLSCLASFNGSGIMRLMSMLDCLRLGFLSYEGIGVFYSLKTH